MARLDAEAFLRLGVEVGGRRGPHEWFTAMRPTGVT